MATSRSFASARPRGAPDPREEALAGGAQEHRLPQAHDRVETAEQLPVVVTGLRETEPGSRIRRSERIPASSNVSALRQFAGHVDHDIVIDRARLHVGAVAAPVHGDERQPALDGEGTIAGSANPRSRR